MKGHISTEHTVWCGAHLEQLSFCASYEKDDPEPCDQWFQTSDPRPAAQARVGGWIATKRYGWLCPKCARKLLAPPSGTPEQEQP